MTTDQLLIQRYKCIAPYPGIKAHGWKVGDILDRNWCEYQNGDEDAGVIEWQISDFTANFQPLPWYAERELSDMPEYVKSKGVIYKVKKWTGSFQNIQWIGCYVHGDIIFIYSDDLQPATPADHEAYQQSKYK
jgi:hypothetical protein